MGTGVDALPYVDALIKEYLLFRGFTATLSAFTKDLAADPGCGFQAERITDVIFRQLIPGLDPQQLVEFLEYLGMQLYSRLDSRYEPLVSAVEADLLRLFLVTAHKAGRPDSMAEFFRLYGPQLVSNSSRGSSSSTAPLGVQDTAADWKDWFLLPYLQNPEREARFQLYFSSEWASLLEVSFRNFIAGVVRSLPLPAVLRFNTDRRLRLALQQQVHALQSELERAQQQLVSALDTVQELQHTQQPSSNSATPHMAMQQPRQQQASAAGHAALHTQQSGDDFRLHAPQESALRASHAPPSSSAFAVPGDHDSSSSNTSHGEQVPADHGSVKPAGGSGLFELLPQHSGVQLPVQGPGSSQGGGTGGLQQQGLPRHVRGTSFSGSISFDALTALGAEGQTELDSGEGQGPEQQQQQQEAQQLAAQGRPIPVPSSRASSRPPAVLPPAPASGAYGPGPNPHHSPSPRSFAGALSSSAPTSCSPVMSWAGGSSSSTGVRPRHVPSGHPAAGASAGLGSAAVHQAGAPQAAPVEFHALTTAPAGEGVTVTVESHGAADASGSCGSVTALAFSPSGANVASVVGGSSSVHIWSPAGLPGNAARAAVVSCGSPVTCVAWDWRADKLMLIGCGAGGGVRAWHADTRRIMDSVVCEPGFPVVAAVAACPSEPTFVVAANTAPLSSSSNSRQQQHHQQQQHHGRLVTYNARSFKRSSVLSVPGDAAVASLAYSSSGAQLLVGTWSGTALLYEPNSRSSPVRAWQVAAAASHHRPGAAGSGDTAVQVLWRPEASSSSRRGSGGGAPAAGSMLTLCDGVLCEWLLSPGITGPLVAMDVAAAACDALSQQPQEQMTASAADGRVCCSAAASPDGSSIAVVCSWEAAGVLLLLSAAPDQYYSWNDQVLVLLQGALLAGCAGVVTWHSSSRVLVVGGKDGSSMTVSLPVH